MVESVLITVVIKAKKGREVATTDIPGAYLLSDIDEVVHLKLQGRMVELIVMTAPKVNKEYTCIERKGNDILYVEL
eukprot:13619079-Ditylum_brightwellii.AAC.1